MAKNKREHSTQKKRKRKQDSDDEEEERTRNRKEQKRKEKERSESQKSNFAESLHSLPSPDFTKAAPFRCKFWDGPCGEEHPSDELKECRKSLGVLVKGRCDLCPSPIAAISDRHLPESFSKVFNFLELSNPSPIQQQAWPAVLNGANILGIAPTGSGKTLAYCMPMIPHIKARPTEKKPSKVSPIALVVVPTRELAIQVNSNVKSFKKLFGVYSCALYGGQDKETQLDSVTEHGNYPDIVAATPGRLLDLLVRKLVSLEKVTYLVIDEADRMLAMGFAEQLDAISSQIRPDRQTLLFSATFPGKLREISEKWVSESVSIRCSALEYQTSEKEVAKNRKDSSTTAAVKEAVETIPALEAETVNNSPRVATAAPSSSLLTISSLIRQHVHVCAAHKKPRLLIKYVLKVREDEKKAKQRQPGPMLIFCTKIVTVKFVMDFFKRQGLDAGIEMLHGNLPQNQREDILSKFRAGKIHTLCATDVAARGIHVKRLQYVVNYDFPSTLEQYCHRVGRTGRSTDCNGESYSLITRSMTPMAADLVALLQSCKQTIEPHLLEMATEPRIETETVVKTSSEVGESGEEGEEEWQDEDVDELLHQAMHDD